MSDPLDITDAEAEGLAELAALDLAMARTFAARAQAAEDPEVANALARTYQRMARSYRQTLALKSKLQKDRTAAAKHAPPPPPGMAAYARRYRDLKTALLRILWSEAERERWDFETFGERVQDVGMTVNDELETTRFCDEGFDDHLARLALDLDLDLEAVDRWRDLPDPPEAMLYRADAAEPTTRDPAEPSIQDSA